MPETHARRRAALQDQLRERDLDALLIVDLLNVRYLTGFTGSNAALRMACAAADRALAGLIEHGGLGPGRTEREVARDLEGRMLDHGASSPSFESIVAAGANSAIPHHRPTDTALRAGDLVKLDFG